MTIHSNDGKSGQTKLERIGQLSTKNRETVFNNIGHVIDISMLKEMYYQLNGQKAVGIDAVTKILYGEKLCTRQFFKALLRTPSHSGGRRSKQRLKKLSCTKGEKLEENLKDLMMRIRRGTYRPKPARLVEIPKEDGSTRPLAISCLEDKLVQSAVNKILVCIYEPIFLPESYGFRPGKNCHQALRALNNYTYQYYDGSVVEIDLRKCFNTLPHGKVMECLKKKIADKRFLRLVYRLMRTSIVDGNNQAMPNEIGCPQGSSISPTIANIYLHEVVDEWFAKIKQEHLKGKAEMVRYCDDMVFIFQRREDAERFYRVLPKRLEKYGLSLHLEKSQLIRSGQIAAREAAVQGERLTTYNFLGFTCYWEKSRNGYWRLKYTSRRDRFTAKLKSLRQYLRDNLNTPDTERLLEAIVRVVKGWINYHGISDNQRRVKAFLEHVKRILFAWFNRRGRKPPINWATFNRVLRIIQFPRSWKIVSMFPKLADRSNPQLSREPYAVVPHVRF